MHAFMQPFYWNNSWCLYCFLYPHLSWRVKQGWHSTISSFTFCIKVVGLVVASPLQSERSGSKPSNNSKFFFCLWPYTCFYTGPQTFSCCSLLFLGTLYLQVYDVMGSGYSISSVVEGVAWNCRSQWHQRMEQTWNMCAGCRFSTYKIMFKIK